MPFESSMKFFTPELFLRLGSRDEDEALAADNEWETAITRYQEYLKPALEKMPPEVAKLTQLYLHGAEFLERKEEKHPFDVGVPEPRPGQPPWPVWCGVETVALRSDDTIVTLLYFLWDHVVEQPSPKDWPNSKEREHWLYDEVHPQQVDRGRYTHVILLSSGAVVSVPFTTVLISRFPVAPAQAENGKQSA